MAAGLANIPAFQQGIIDALTNGTSIMRYTVNFPRKQGKDDYVNPVKWQQVMLEEYWMGATETCHYCNEPLDEVGGDRIWPHREDLAKKRFAICWPCSAWVGLKDDGTAQGYNAKEHIRELRSQILSAWTAVCDTGAMTYKKADEFRNWLREEKGYDISHLGHLEEEQLVELLRVLDKLVIPDTPEINALFD